MLGQPGRHARPGAAGKHDRIRAELLARRGSHAFDPLAVEQRSGRLGVGADFDIGLGEGAQQRGAQLARIDDGLVGRMHAAVERRRQAGLELTATARRQPLGGEPKRALQVVDAAQLRCLVAVEGDVERTLASVARALPAGRLELGDESRVALGGRDGHAQQLGLAEGELPDRRQHAGGNAGGTGRRLGALEHGDPGATLRGAPGATEADRSASDYNDVIAAASLAQIRASAGITRIRSRRSVASLPPSQPLRLP